jgi:hypothetical protein
METAGSSENWGINGNGGNGFPLKLETNVIMETGDSRSL